ncbi:4-hydroxybenzoate polyprenyltransferase, mitochondrial [Quillaja saponaria]|uniref:4-hydroxybenzoate polyprenyltransferase, mitochondrial n=1 Tax=Quillaja saponaria TaxID=32244 RepID=A0AAD7PM05_QUISA|nr:4-hydroxybenzoate polyprenyltransferase, mitochondrial [Quillaja saponaria]
MPIGIWLVGLLTYPLLWSIALAAPQGHLPNFKTLILFAVGAIPFRCAACTINEILDSDIDRLIERTKSRPIACGAVTPFQGLCFFGLEILLGLAILLPALNTCSRLLGIPFLFLTCTYPLMKRITYWPQAYLGLNFNWGALLGWAAVKGSLDLKIVLPLYIGGVFWTLVYDTIYAHQDREEDMQVGVKSTALLFGNSTKTWTTGFAIACIASLALSGYNARIGWPFYVSLIAASGQLGWQIWTVDLSSGDDCKSKFVSNKWFAGIVFSGILIGRLLP